MERGGMEGIIVIKAKGYGWYSAPTSSLTLCILATKSSDTKGRTTEVLSVSSEYTYSNEPACALYVYVLLQRTTAFTSISFNVT
jgi:hypothetical protein